MKANITDCPRRLYDEAVLLNKGETPVWMSRRANKMRERFTTEEYTGVETLSLVAPVQPSPRYPATSH